MPVDLRGRRGVYVGSMSEIYEGALLWKDLKTMRRTLNLILYFMGSQWKDFRMGLKEHAFCPSDQTCCGVL